MTSPVLLLDMFVAGTPRPKGSLTPQKVRAGNGQQTGRIRLVDSDLSKRWRRTVAQAARDGLRAWGREGLVFTGPVVVAARFRFVRCCAETIDQEPHVGDLDKLLRNVYDALQDARVYLNDRQVFRDGGSDKAWVDSIVDFEGARITVWGHQ